MLDPDWTAAWRVREAYDLVEVELFQLIEIMRQKRNARMSAVWHEAFWEAVNTEIFIERDIEVDDWACDFEDDLIGLYYFF